MKYIKVSIANIKILLVLLFRGYQIFVFFAKIRIL